MDFENTIREGNLLHNFEEYLEKMNNLKEAIGFFSSHSTYQTQLDHMVMLFCYLFIFYIIFAYFKMQIYETGCSYVESQFCNLTKSKSVVLEPNKIFEYLDENYEIPNFRFPNLNTVEEIENLNLMVNWLLNNTPSTQFIDYYANCRSENMLKTLKAINDQIAGVNALKKSHFIKKYFFFNLKRFWGKNF